MQKEVLGQIIWTMIHTLIEKMNPEGFTVFKRDLINVTNFICGYYSLNEKSQLFNVFFKNLNFVAIDQLYKFKNLYFLFHNYVNSNIKKPMFDNNDLSLYSKNNLFKVNQYFNILNNNNNSCIQLTNFLNKYSSFIILNIIEEPKVVIVEPEPEPEPEPEVVEVEEKTAEEKAAEEEKAEEERLAKEKELKRIMELRKKYDIYANISIIDDDNLPSLDISLSDAMLEMKKRKLEPFKPYMERWQSLHNKKYKISKKVDDEPVINDLLLPSLALTFPIALSKIKANPKCIPAELYIKRWNELKTLNSHKKNKK
jgi:hypothetical protein